MRKFEILCVTMGQSDFSLIRKMNVKSDIVYANQADCFSFLTEDFGDFSAKMYTTNTVGVGINRNIGLLLASAEICLLADDDIVYSDDYESIVVDEFDNHPDADVIIFNIGTTTPQYGRIPTQIKKYKYLHFWSKKPYGAPRIAFRLNSIKNSNIMFSTLFGGGCKYLCGEDTIFLNDLLKKKKSILLSPKKIGSVSYSNSSWFTKNEDKFYYDKGAMFEAKSTRTALFFALYYSVFRRESGTKFNKVLKWILRGEKGYKKGLSYDDFLKGKLK